jgi:hypothetical protein
MTMADPIRFQSAPRAGTHRAECTGCDKTNEGKTAKGWALQHARKTGHALVLTLNYTVVASER